MKKILLMVVAALMAINANAQQEIVKKVRVYERNNLVYENYYSSVDSIVFVDIIQNPEFSQCYAWGVQGTLDDENPSNTPVEQLINAIAGHNDISDAELTALGMTIYTGVVYDGDTHSLNDGFLVVLSKQIPTLIDSMGHTVNSSAWWDYGIITRGSVVNHIYIFPDDSIGTNGKYRNLTLNP